MTNLLVAQSGGPTAAINATLAGIIKEGQRQGSIGTIYGSLHGIQGLLEEKLIDLGSQIDDKKLPCLCTTPAAALGSCRLKLKDMKEDDSEYRAILQILHKYQIGYFIYIGGNDSMDTVYKLSTYCREHEIHDICVVGAPKTIDNDLFGIDHCPGFGSAAKYIATVCAELEREIEVYEVPNVIIVEMMGRNAGWLTAAAALSAGVNSSVPYLIYLEERTFDMRKFIADVREKLAEHQNVIVAVSEGIHDKNGKFISSMSQDDEETDAFGHQQLAGTGKVLEKTVRKKIGCKVRSIELNLLQRCASHLLSETDIRESFELGKNAVLLALNGENGKMSSLRRISDKPYQVVYEPVAIEEVANQEKKVPKDWINENGNGVTDQMIAYLRPLIQGETSCSYQNGIPKYIVLF